MFDHDGSMMAFGGGLMWIFWIILLAILFVILKEFFRSSPGNPTKPDENPLDILKNRYARGEIDEEEYERRRIELEK